MTCVLSVAAARVEDLDKLGELAPPWDLIPLSIVNTLDSVIYIYSALIIRIVKNGIFSLCYHLKSEGLEQGLCCTHGKAFEKPCSDTLGESSKTIQMWNM